MSRLQRLFEKTALNETVLMKWTKCWLHVEDNIHFSILKVKIIWIDKNSWTRKNCITTNLISYNTVGFFAKEIQLCLGKWHHLEEKSGTEQSPGRKGMKIHVEGDKKNAPMKDKTS